MGELNIVIPEPNDRQKLFLADHHKYVAFGGARGGGKSWSIRTKAILLAFSYPGIKQTIFRRNYKELTDNHIDPLKAMMPYEAYSYNDGRKEMAFPNGSKILFRHLNNARDLEKYRGTETDVLYIDEATQFSFEEYSVLKATVRGVGNYPRRIYLTTNPGGIGHSWVKRLFVDRQFEPNEIPEEYSFIKSRVLDNKILMETNPDYVSQLEALPPKLRKAWLEGDWNIFEGMFFEEFRDDPEHYLDRKWTHVIEPFEIPPDWKIYRSFDWGYSKPFSCGWWAVDYDGVAYRILEWYGCTDEPNTGIKLISDKVFAEIHRIECEHRWLKGKQIIGVADPAIWNAETGMSDAEVAASHGVYFNKGDNARIPGWMQMHYRLFFDENGEAMMYVFKNCKAFIRTIPTLLYDEYKVEDLDTDGEDHVADECRYFCMSRVIKPRMAAAPDPYNSTPQAMYLDIPKEDIIARPHRERLTIKE